uniref:Uncharacterized protein n=1 Tax=Capra hircus TaxID=9925 RepID=A0A8C2RWV6_CAPHI
MGDFTCASVSILSFPSPHHSNGSSFFCFQGDNDGERKHQKLLESISSLNGKDRQKLADRSEASLKVSEFSVSSEGKLTKETVCMDLVEFQKHNGLLPLGALFPAIFDVVSESYHTYLPMSE